MRNYFLSKRVVNFSLSEKCMHQYRIIYDKGEHFIYSIRQRRLTKPFSLSKWGHIYWHLSKGRLSSWVALSSLAGVAAGWQYNDLALVNTHNIETMAIVFSGVLLSAASANSLNQIIEKDLDKQMQRTMNRPVASGVLTSKAGLSWAAVSGLAGAGILKAAFPLSSSAELSLLTIFLYSAIYTPAKIRNPYCTHVGAVVGGLPLLIGWNAVGGTLMDPTGWLLFLIQYIWQFPHFYTLSFLYCNDYSKAGYRMFGLNDYGGVSKSLALCNRYSKLLFICPMVSSLLGITSYMYVVSTLLPNLYIMNLLKQFNMEPTKKTAMKFFLHSLWHVILCLCLYVYHLEPVETREARYNALKRFVVSGWNDPRQMFHISDDADYGKEGSQFLSTEPAYASVSSIQYKSMYGITNFHSLNMLDIKAVHDMFKNTRSLLKMACPHEFFLMHGHLCPVGWSTNLKYSKEN